MYQDVKKYMKSELLDKIKENEFNIKKKRIL